MVYISNSDLESRLKASRKRREQQFAAYTKGATDVAGWQTGTTNQEALDEENRLKNRSTLQKVTDKAKEIGGAISESYRSLGHTLGSLASEVPGTDLYKNKKAHESAQQDLLHQLTEINHQRFDRGPITPEQDAKLKKQFDAIKKNFDDSSNAYDWEAQNVKNLSAKKTAADVANITTDILSAGSYGAATRGAQAGRLFRAGEVGERVAQPVLKTVLRRAATGAITNVAGQVPQELLDNEKGVNLKRIGQQAGLGAVLGGLSGGLDVRANNRAANALAEADRASMSAVDESAGKAASALDAEDAFRKATYTSNQPLMLDAGQGRIDRRIGEIDKELEGYRQGTTDPNAYSSDPQNLDTLAGEPAGDTRLTKSGEPFKNTKSGVFAQTTNRTITSAEDTAKRTRELMRERDALVKERDGLSSITKYDGAEAPKLDVRDPQFKDAVDNELQAVDNAAPTPTFKDKPTGKVNALIDYFRTPTKVLKKIGLSDTADVVEHSFETYRKSLRTDMKQIQSWSQRVKSPGASERIFKYLDGQKIGLTGEELKVATEMKGFLKGWADKLGLPEDSRVSDYITHIFEGDLKGKTNDVTLSSILDKNGTTRSYNPFTQKRLGKAGYKEDVFAALDAYVKKSNRQLHMSPALKITADAAQNVDDRTARYLLKLNQSIAMKPDKMEQILNDVAASVTGDRFGDRLATRAMRAWRNTVYRATLGLNFGSAVRNLTQGTNTFAELGARRTVQGYTKIMRTFAQALEEKASGKTVTAWDELFDNGILDDAFHAQDRTLSAVKSTIQKVDTGLWAMFDTAEKINRGAAYYAAKAKGLAQKMTEEEAIAYAKDVVGKTQFRFNDIETPLALRSQVAKTVGQFQSFNIKQAEFLGGIAKGALKGNTKDIAKAVRWVGANIAMASTIGSLMGIKWWDAVPDFGTFRGVQSPLLQTAETAKEIIGGKNQYGQDTPRGDLVKSGAKDLFGLTVPAGTQTKKTYEGLQAVNRGASVTDSGKIRYTIPKTGENQLRAGLFGQYSLDEGQDYFAHGRQALSDKQTEVLNSVPSGEEKAYETLFRNMSEKRDSKLNTANKIKEEIKNKNFVKAKRLADEHNAGVEQELSNLSGQVGRPPKEITDYIRSTYKVNYQYYLDNKNKK